MKKNHPIRRALVLSVCVMIATLSGVYAYGVWQVKRLNSRIEVPETGGKPLVRFEMGRDCTVRARTGSKVFFDMGSRHSFVSSDEVERFRAIGYPLTVERCFIVTTDPAGRYRTYTQKVVMDLPLPNPELPDSTCYLHHAELLVSDHGNDNILGMDILRQFVIERRWNSNELLLYRETPENYFPVCKINVYGASVGGPLSTSLRASVVLQVNNDEPREYFFDTGVEMRHIELVQPLDRSSYALSEITTDSISGLPVQKRCFVAFGDRIRYSSVIYCDTLHTDKYSVNPLRLFDQDMVLDMPGKRLLVHKTRDGQ